MPRFFVLAVALLFAGAGRAAALKTAPDPNTHDGKVVSAGSGKLVLAEMGGKESMLSVSDSVVVTINGKMAKLEDLKKGTAVRVRTNTTGEVTTITTLDGPTKRGREQWVRGQAADLPRPIRRL